ncbi:MAG: hypothetical protein ABJJ53_14290 [Sulfitobacter sp.]
MNNVTSFSALLETDPTMAKSFEVLTDRLIADSKPPLTKDQCKQLTSVRLATLTQTDVDQEQYTQELSDNFEIFRRSRDEASQIQMLMDKKLAEAEAAEKALGLSDMDPAQRLAFGRANNLISTKAPEPAKAPTDPQEKARLLVENSKLRSGMKMAHARAHGLF